MIWQVCVRRGFWNSNQCFTLSLHYLVLPTFSQLGYWTFIPSGKIHLGKSRGKRSSMLLSLKIYSPERTQHKKYIFVRIPDAE